MNMQTVKVSELSGAALDWAVAKYRGHQWRCPWMLEQSGYQAWRSYEESWGNPTPNYSTDWAQGGPIIDEEFIEVKPGSFIGTKDRPRLWAAWGQDRHGNRQQGKTGPTALIAAMRCYVSSKLGDIVEIPEELLK